MATAGTWHDDRGQVLEFGIVLDRLGVFRSTRDVLAYFEEPWAYGRTHDLWLTFEQPTDPQLDRHAWRGLLLAHRHDVTPKHCQQCDGLARFFTTTGEQVHYWCVEHCPKRATEWVDAIGNAKVPIAIRDGIEA